VKKTCWEEKEQEFVNSKPGGKRRSRVLTFELSSASLGLRVSSPRIFFILLGKNDVRKGGWRMKRIKRVLVWYLVGALFVIGVTPRCFAGFSPSEGMTLSPMERPQDLQKLQKFLETKMVGERLKDLGFTPEEIQMKLGDLSDQQVHQMALHLDEMKVAGDGVAIFIAVFLIAVLVVLIVYATGHRIVLK
jgi:hypothetical protein